MGRSSKDFTYDSDLELKDSYAVGDNDEPAEVGSAAKILDLGQARVDGRVIVDVVACEVASNDEVYTIQCQFSDVFDFDTGSEVIVNGSCLVLGALEITKATADTAVGERIELPFTNEIDGTVYRYFRLWTETAGTIGSGGINYTAFAVKDA